VQNSKIPKNRKNRNERSLAHYMKNRDRINQERRDQIRDDPDYRNKKNKQNRDYRIRKKFTIVLSLNPSSI